MELRHVYGRTYAAVGATALMPVYKLTDTDIVLMDTGYARLDRSALVNLIEGNGFRLRGIICSHAHFDHTGNVRYLQQRYGCQAAAQIIEAGISVNPDAYRANYVALTYGKSREIFLEECFIADAIIPADADHLDIYGTHEAVKEAFSQFVRQIRPGGSLIIKRGVDIVIDNPGIAVYRYSYDEPCDFYARNVQLLEGGHYRYDLVTPSGAFEGCTLGVPGWVNIENAVAAVASVWCAAKAGGTPLDADKLRGALASFSGVKRRFEFYVNTPKQVYMDDYAHHPRELAATLTSVRKMFPGRRITALFQPHLYTRTRDLHAEFAEALSHADEVVLLPIYPAREEPIPGITSEIIARRVAAPCRIVDRDHLADEVAAMDTDVVISFGAGNIDACCPALAERLKMKS